MSKRESKSIDLRERVEKELKENSRSKSLFLPKDGVVLKFVYEDDYFKALGDGVYSFKGFIEFLNGSKSVKVYNGVLRKTGNGYVLEGNFSLGYRYVFEVVEDATGEDVNRGVARGKKVLEKKEVGDEEKPTVVRYGFKTGREVLYDLEREIIASGLDGVEKVEGAYLVRTSLDGKTHGVIRVWEGPGSEGETLAKTTTPGEELLLDIDKNIIATGWGVGKEEGAYKVRAAWNGEVHGVIRVWEGPGSEGKELAKVTTPGEWLLLDIDKKIVATGGDVYKRGGVYTVAAFFEDFKIPARFVIDGNLVLEKRFGKYKVFQEGDVWRIYRVDEDVFQAVVDLDNDINVSGYEVEVLDKGVYKVTGIGILSVNVKTLDGKPILENAKGVYKVFKKGDSWQVEKLE